MFLKKTAENGVLYECSDRFTAKHLFSTRIGGVSRAEYLASMNLGENRGDFPENVKTNFDRLLMPIGRSFSDCVRAGQVHSANIRTVTEDDRGKFFPDTDGFVTDRGGVVLIVKIADCLPILLSDAENHVAAAVHAGWRGSAAKIAAAAVEKMCALGAKPENITAALGACIHSCCFEVKDDFVDALTSMCGADLAEKTVAVRDGKMYADLVGLNIAVLSECGVSIENIDVNPACTCCEPNLYFSHRYSGGRRGTMAAAVTMDLTD